MSDYTRAVAAMIEVAGGIVPEAPYIDLKKRAERALKTWIQDIVNQPSRAVPAPAIITDLKMPLAKPMPGKIVNPSSWDHVRGERRKPGRAKGPALERLPVAETFPEIRAI